MPKPTTFAEAVPVIVDLADKQYDLVHGDANTVVPTDNGPVPSAAKAVADLNAEYAAQDVVARSVAARDEAKSAATTATAAAQASLTNGQKYATQALGHAATADGGYFDVIGDNVTTEVIRFQRVNSNTDVVVTKSPAKALVDALNATIASNAFATANGYVLQFLAGDEWYDLGGFDLAQGAFDATRYRGNAGRIINITTDIEDGADYMFRLTDGSADAYLLIGVRKSDGTIVGKFDGVFPARLENAGATAQQALDAVNALGGGIKGKLIKAITAARSNNPILFAADPTRATIDATQAAIPAALTVRATAAVVDAVFTYRGGFPQMGYGIALPTIQLPAGVTGNAGNYNIYYFGVEFMTDAPQLFAEYQAGTGANLRVIVDGVYVSDAGYTLPNVTGGKNGLLIDFAGVRKPRHIQIEGQYALGFYGVNVDSASKIWAVDKDNDVAGVVNADSHGTGTGATTANAGYTQVLAKLLGIRDMRQLAIGGTGYCNRASGTGKTYSVFGERVPQMATIAKLALIIFEGSSNDSDTSTYPTETVKAAALKAWQDARALQPTLPIIVLGLPGGYSPTYVTMENALADQFAAWNDPNSLFVRIQTDPAGPWITGSGRVGATTGVGNADVTIADGTHMVNYGHYYVATRMYEKIYNWIMG